MSKKVNNPSPKTTTNNDSGSKESSVQQYPTNVSNHPVQSGPADELDEEYGPEDERIDFSKAYLKESRDSEEILSRLKQFDLKVEDLDKVYTGFAKHLDDKMMDKKAMNRLIFDVLPSFEMYHAVQYSTPRSAYGTDLDNEHPPDYFNHKDDQIFAVRSGESSSTGTPSLATQMLTPATSTRADDHIAPMTSTDQNILRAQDFERNMIDKSHTLKNVNTSNIEISIHVTKDVPQANQTSEFESMLKEYTSGDVVHGYVVVDNVSDVPIQFDMFHVTLEGVTTIIDIQNRKQSVKRFLTMVDMSASWSFGSISPSANISFDMMSLDIDGCIIGLRNDRILAPHTKYKKFFTFKFPYNLLDTACRHQQETHTLLPPSLGVDKLRKRGKYLGIEVNPLLNYGHLGYRGSPIMTHDLCSNGSSICYSINAKIIGTSPKAQNRICVLKDQEYCLRFIPYGFAVPLFTSKETLDSMCANIEHGFEVAEHVLKLRVEGRTKDVEAYEVDMKNRQLSTRLNRYNGSSNYGDFPLRNKPNGKSDDYFKVETCMNYIKSNNGSSSGFLTKLRSSKSHKNQTNQPLTKSGLITISTKVPKDGIPYLSPSLLRKTNEIGQLSEFALKNYDTLSSSLSTNEKKKLTSIRLKFKFSPSDNSIHDIKPPEIKTIKTALLAWNITSSTSIPLKLSSDLLTNKKIGKVKDTFTKYLQRFKDLQTRFELIDLDLDRYIDPSLQMDMTALKDLDIEPFRISAFETPIVQDETGWIECEADQQDVARVGEINEWTKILNLKMDYKTDLSETLVPNFQSCLISRVYCIEIEVKFKDAHCASLVIPIRIRKFDDF